MTPLVLRSQSGLSSCRVKMACNAKASRAAESIKQSVKGGGHIRWGPREPAEAVGRWLAKPAGR